MYRHDIAHGLMFHHFCSESHPRVEGAITADQFAALLDYVGCDRILTPAEWLERLGRGTLRSEDLCITLDDALRCQWDIALPVLEARGLKAFWFVYSAVFQGEPIRLELYRMFRNRYFSSIDEFLPPFLERAADLGLLSDPHSHLDDEQIQEVQRRHPFYSENDIRFRFMRDKFLGRADYEAIMDAMIADRGLDLRALAEGLWLTDEHLRQLANKGHEAGLHSHSHPTAMTALDPADQQREYERNAAHIEAVCGRAAVSMSHPCNSYNDETIRILEDLGVCCGFRANMFARRAGDNLNTNPLEIAREDHMNILRQMND